MRITVNGKNVECPDGSSLADLLQQLELDSRTVVVEHNRNIVAAADLAEVRPTEGDVVELVRLVGGG